MRRMRMVRRSRVGRRFIVNGVVISCFLLCFLMLVSFNRRVTPRINEMVLLRVDKLITNAVPSIMDDEVFNQSEMGDVLRIEKNSDNEVISIDYDMVLASQLMREGTNHVAEVVNSVEDGIGLGSVFDHRYIYSSSEGIVVLVPVGMASGMTFFNQLGPRVPVLVDVMSTYYSTLESKVTDYGLNSLMVELYLRITVTSEVSLNYTDEELTKEYVVLVDSRVINGRIPVYFGDSISKSSPLVTNQI